MTLASQVGPALRAFFRQAAAWQLTPAEQRALLGQPSETTFYRWQRGEAQPGDVTLDLIERLSHLFGIYGALHGIYVGPARYAATQRWAAARYVEGAEGVVYDSVRRPAWCCVAVFHPGSVIKCRVGDRLAYEWDGRRCVAVHTLAPRVVLEQ